ncbi:MAG: MerR family transcriptional regulator [Candidatus Korobacteraceae bacterium]
MTISQLARRHGLSRATLLYYDRVGVLRPSGRLPNGYRCYAMRDDARLKQVRLYRDLGLPLAQIRNLTGRRSRALAGALERQLRELAAQIQALRGRQRMIVALLGQRRLLEQTGVLGKDAWVALLCDCGFSEADMDAWHRDFERTDPDYHERFLKFLGLPADRIRWVREKSRM